VTPSGAVPPWRCPGPPPGEPPLRNTGEIVDIGCDAVQPDTTVERCDGCWSVYAAVGPQRADDVFRALAKVLHSDVGGDDHLMRDLLAARNMPRSA